MRQSTFILYGDNNKYVSLKMSKEVYADHAVYSDSGELTEVVLLDMCNRCIGNYFYVIKTDYELLFPDFKFDYVPPEWDKEFIHIWNDNTNIRLFSKDAVLKNPAVYTDSVLLAGTARLKNINSPVYDFPVFDIIFISYDEFYADENYAKLQARFPKAKRIERVKGIYEAHYAAAKYADYDDSDMFYVVDADAIVLPEFDFSYQPHSLARNSVHVWHSRNPVNGLEYGYGAIKLFPTKRLLSYTGSPVDFTTSVSDSLKVIPEVSNITKFDTDPFSAWRSGFRECTKLAANIIRGGDDNETRDRLDTWCGVGLDTVYGDFVIMGANDGAAFGRENANKPDQLKLINDFKWLEDRFNS